MLDLKLIRDNPEFVKAGIRKKQRDPALVDRVLEIDRRRREVVQEVERLRAEQNRASGEIALLLSAWGRRAPGAGSDPVGDGPAAGRGIYAGDYPNPGPPGDHHRRLGRGGSGRAAGLQDCRRGAGTHWHL